MAAPDHRWEWTLPEGVKIAATLDAGERVESVFVGDRLASQAPRGAKPAGHSLEEPSGVVVRFQPGALICILRVDGDEVSPNVWPVRKRVERPKPRMVALPLRGIGIGIAALLAAGGGYWAWTSHGASGDAAGAALGSSFRAENGRFVTHHPSRFVVGKPQLPPDASGVALVDADRAESVVVLAYTGPDLPTDPWLVQRKLQPEGLASLPRGGPTYEEVSRKDDTCLGNAGAVVVGNARTPRGDAAKVWSCAFAHDGAAYLLMYSVRADASSEDGHLLREIVDATEVTRLGELQGH
jgi:hypothetical protein